MRMKEMLRPPGEMRELSLLQELERNPVLSQRELSKRFGIALGVTNACLKRMIRKGWVQIKGLDHHRTGYYLTPRGVAEKTKLTFDFISWTVQHYSSLKELIRERLTEIRVGGAERIVFYGVGEEMEVAYVTLQEMDLKLVGIVEDDKLYKPQFIFGYELEPVSRIRDLKPDCVLITSLAEKERKRESLKMLLVGERISIKDVWLPESWIKE